jgi:membrane-associated phospholipid phosphatase
MGQKILLTILFLLVSTGVFAQGIDLRLLEYINGPVSPTADNNWRFVSNASYYIDFSVPAGLVLAGIVNHDEALRIKGYDAAASLLIAAGAEVVLKDIVKRERPFVTHPGLIIPKVTETDYSFPSGHSSLAFAAASSLSIAIPKWYVIVPSYAYAGAVGYSRLYLGVHYPSDVLAGAIIGAGSSYLTLIGQHWLERRQLHKVHQPQ